MVNAPKLLKLPESECPDIWIRLPWHKWPKSWHNIEERVVSFERTLYGRPLAGLLGERQFERSSSGKMDWRKYQPGNACLCIASQVYFCPCTWMTSKCLGKKLDLESMWERLMKHVDLEKPTTFLDQAYLGCTQRECKPNNNLVDEYWKCSNRQSLQKRLKSCLIQEM